MTLDPTHMSITVNVTVSGLTTPITPAHIHKGAFGVAGGVVIDFSAPTNFANGKLSKTFAIDKQLATTLPRTRSVITSTSTRPRTRAARFAAS